MIPRFFDKRLLVAGLVLAVVFWLLEAVREGTVEFKDLQVGDQYWEANQRVGYKLLTKVAPDMASAFRQTCSGLQHNDFISVKPEHRVRIAGRWEE